MKKVLLYSGGMDSWLIDKLWRPDVRLYVDVGGRYSNEEIKRLPNNVIIERIDIGKFEMDDLIIPLRNLFFVMMASYHGDLICLGATSGDRPLDKGQEFAERASDILSFLLQKQRWTEGREIKIVVPFKDYSKAQLLSLYLQQGGSLEEAFSQTFSCYSPTDSGGECWSCKACMRKAVPFILNGYRLPSEQARLLLAYMDREMPKILAAEQGRGQEDAETIQAYEMLLHRRER